MAVKVTGNRDVKRGIKVYLDGKEVAANATAIRAKMKEIEKELKNMTIGSEEYRRKVKDWDKLNVILKEHKANLRAIAKQQETVEGGFKSMFKRGAELFSKYSLQIFSVIQGLTGVAMQLNRFRQQAAEKEDAAANLKALTGLSDENIQWLQQQAETLSTTMEKSGLRVRKSATEILEAYMLVGSAKPELLQDKEALNAVTIEAMRLAEAAKMDLKDSVQALTTSLNQFSAGADQAVRFTNALAAGSKFGAANVQDQAAAVVKAGVAASSAGVSFEQLVGVIEMLGEKGIKAEVAGTGLKTFFLKLQTGADDTNPAIVGLDQALQNLAAKGLSMGELEKMFGDRAINIAKILVDNTDKVKQYTDAVTGTNTAVEQAAINSDTTAAKMAQVRNQINLTGQELAKTLAPIMSKTVGWSRRFVMMLPEIIDFLKKWGVQLLVLAAAYNALAIKNAVATVAQKAWNTAVSLGKGIAGGFRAMLLMLHAGYTLLTKGMAAAKLEMTALNAAMKANAFGIIITLGVALYEVITRLINRTKELTKEQKLQRDMQRDVAEAEREGNKQTAETESKIKQLSAVVHDNNRTLKDRKIALQELKKIVPEYHAELTSEGKLIKDNTTALKDYLKNLKEVAVQQALQTKMTKLVEAELNQQESRSRRDNAARIRRDRLSAFDAEHPEIRDFTDRLKRSDGDYGEVYSIVRQQMKAANVGENTAYRQLRELAKQRYHILETIREAEGWVSEADDAIKNIQKRQENLQKQGADIVKALPNAVSNINAADAPDLPQDGTKPSGVVQDGQQDRQKRIREEIEAVNAEYDERALQLKKKYLEGEIASEQEFANRLQKLEIERLGSQLRIAGTEPEERRKIQEKILDISIKLKEKLKSIDERHEEDSRQIAKRATETFLKQKEEEAKRLEEIAKEEEDKQKKLFDALQSAGEEMGQALGDWLTDTNKTFKDFSKELLKTIVKTVKNIMTAAIAQRTIDNIKDLGYAGIAKAAGEIALIEAAGAALNGLISNFYTGGYTGQGRWDEPRGVVHAGEFVANRYAVANDAVRPVLDLIDQAQRSGSIANLTADDIAAVARPSAPPVSAATVPVASASGALARDPELTAALRLLTRTTARAAEAYQEPSPAFCYLEGKGGINTAQDLLIKMKSNASRKVS